MATREIARERWSSELDAFSSHHAGWIVTLEVLGREFGEQPEANGLPLTGIVVESRQSAARIEILVGGRRDAHVTHIVEGPCRVWLREPDVDGDEAVEVECDDGTRTLLYFGRLPVELQLPAS